MNKKDIVDRVAQRTEMPMVHVDKVISTFMETIVEGLEEGERVRLKGFGTFATRHRKGRSGRNPFTGEDLTVPPQRVPYFRPGKVMKGKLNDG